MLYLDVLVAVLPPANSEENIYFHILYMIHFLNVESTIMNKQTLLWKSLRSCWTERSITDHTYFLICASSNLSAGPFNIHFKHDCQLLGLLLSDLFTIKTVLKDTSFQWSFCNKAWGSPLKRVSFQGKTK